MDTTSKERASTIPLTVLDENTESAPFQRVLCLPSSTLTCPRPRCHMPDGLHPDEMSVVLSSTG